jgi:hypothetical protein
MLVTIYMKNPGSVDFAIKEATEGKSQKVIDDVRESIEKFVECGKYITVVIDTDAGTAEVKEV